MCKRIFVSILILILFCFIGCTPAEVLLEVSDESDPDKWAGELDNGAYVAIKDARLEKNEDEQYCIVVSLDFSRDQEEYVWISRFVDELAFQGDNIGDFSSEFTSDNRITRQVTPGVISEYEIGFILCDPETPVEIRVWPHSISGRGEAVLSKTFLLPDTLEFFF